jgi:murein DD-endopeptidase MepM/ murein hydrolase activator NlpD
MSLRRSSERSVGFAGVRNGGSAYVLSLSRGGEESRAALEPWAFWTLALLLPLFCALGLAGGALVVFRDEVFLALMRRQADMQLAHEARVSDLRGRIDRLAARQVLDRDTIEGQLQDLISRQARLESRSAMVAALAEGAGGAAALERSLAASSGASPAPPTVPATAARPGLADAPGRGAPSFAPRAGARPQGQQPPAGANAQTPRRGASLDPLPMGGPDQLAPEAGANGLRGTDFTAPHAAARLARISAAIHAEEERQTRALAGIGAVAREEAGRLRLAFAELGVHADRFLAAETRRSKPAATGAMGGPFTPFKVNPDGSPFEREVARLQDDVRHADRLRRALGDAPLGRPLPAHAETTSGFGARVDPFLGRPAHHAGVDFRDAHGAPVRATGAGRVSHAGPAGGYGNLVEIDHGGGLATRYAHLSAIDVVEGQFLPAGTVVGRLGSTGRSTGPHLHYEVRIDDEPVDPMRFLRAGQRLFAGG